MIVIVKLACGLAQIVMSTMENVLCVKIMRTAWFTETNSVEMEDVDEVR